MSRHNLVTVEDASGRPGWACTICSQKWKNEPGSTCPGVPVYGWSKWPEHLLTKKQLSEAGFQTGKRLPAPAGAAHREKSPGGWMWLYDKNQGVPKKVMSDKQRAALEKVKHKSLEKRTCTRCGRVNALGRRGVKDGLCFYCREDDQRKADREAASKWAREILTRDDVLILDTETTDLDGEVIELAIINLQGETIYNGRFNPISAVSDEATAVHGITAQMLANEPCFADRKLDVFVPLITARLVLIYNKAFDLERLRYTCQLHGVDMPNFKTDCAMLWYAQWCGEWSTYWGNYRWQPLNGGHTALEDCRATLSVIREMAESGG